MGLFDDLFGNDKKKNQQNNSGYSDEELDTYGFGDWQNKEIKGGNYNSWDFEEELLKEDDYYFKDD